MQDSTSRKILTEDNVIPFATEAVMAFHELQAKEGLEWEDVMDWRVEYSEDGVVSLIKGWEKRKHAFYSANQSLFEEYRRINSYSSILMDQLMDMDDEQNGETETEHESNRNTFTILPLTKGIYDLCVLSGINEISGRPYYAHGRKKKSNANDILFFFGDYYGINPNENDNRDNNTVDFEELISEIMEAKGEFFNNVRYDIGVLKQETIRRMLGGNSQYRFFIYHPMTTTVSRNRYQRMKATNVLSRLRVNKKSIQ